MSSAAASGGERDQELGRARMGCGRGWPRCRGGVGRVNGCTRRSEAAMDSTGARSRIFFRRLDTRTPEPEH